MTILDWTNYFKDLATKHVAILHSDSAKHFFRAELDDFFQDIRAKAKFPAVMLESSLLDLTADTASNTATRTLAFTIIDNCRLDDYPSITQTQSICEDIAISFLGRLRNDISSGALSNVRFLSAHFEPIANESLHYYGQRVEIIVSEPRCMYTSTDWTDETH